MANILDPKSFGLKIYNRFPMQYRMDDIEQNYALRRYIESASEGGFKHVIEEQNGLLDLINPQKASLEVIYLLYEQYGLEMFHGIPEEFLRSFLPNIGRAWSKKGSLDVLEDIVSSLSGIKTSVIKDAPLITVRLEMDYNTSGYFPDIKQFERILTNFLPYYCDANLLFSYFYMESAELKYKSSYGDFITDTRNEPGQVNSLDTLLTQEVSIKQSEIGILNSDAEQLKDTWRIPYVEHVSNLEGSDISFETFKDRKSTENGTVNHTDGSIKDLLVITSPLESVGFSFTSGMCAGMLNLPDYTLNDTLILNKTIRGEYFRDTVKLHKRLSFRDAKVVATSYVKLHFKESEE